MITEWTFIASVDQAALTESVNEKIEEGWQPYGGVGIAFETLMQRDGLDVEHHYDICHYTQAMVLTGDPVDMVSLEVSP